MSLPPVRYTILDGGMGTTLEDSGHNVSSNLWSSDPALRSAVRDVHAGFLDAGAEMIGTATYQACESLYTQDGAMSSDRAHQLMLSQVGVAEEAVKQASQGRTSDVGRGKVGLCLGPFGATLQPGQEYSGLYPPPYGPSSSSTTCPTVSSYTSSLTALREFHLSRLLTYAQDQATWDSLDWVCFETIPLLREALAIRLAMRDLEERLDETYGSDGGRKKWWMAYVFPSGKFPDGSTVKQVVAASILPRPWDAQELGLSYKDLGFDNGNETSSITALFQDRLPVPQAIGINCTSPAHIRQLSRDFTQSVEEILSSSHLDAGEGDIGFVLYPDGGLVYNTTTRSWSVPTGVATAGGEGNGSWARNVAIVAREVGEATRTTSPAGGKEEKTARVWGAGVLVGGCCKNGFAEIKGLRDELKPREG